MKTKILNKMVTVLCIIGIIVMLSGMGYIDGASGNRQVFDGFLISMAGIAMMMPGYFRARWNEK